MALRNILFSDNPRLRKVSKPVKEINQTISNIKKVLGEICDTISEEEKEKYNEFRDIVENIKISESIPVKVNINENIKYFYYYINEFQDYLLEIESN